MDLENQGKLLKRIDINDQVNVMHNYVFGTVQNNTQSEFSLSQYGLSSYDTNCCKIKVSGAGDIRYMVTGTLNGSIMTNVKLKFDTAPPGGIILTASKVNKTDIINAVPSNLGVVTADGTSKATYDGAIVYVADLEGKITKINLTENFTLDSDGIINNVASTTLFNSQANSDNGRYIYNSPELTINNDSNLWLYFGTGNTQKLQEQSNSIQNRVFGIKDKDFPSYVNINSPGDVSKCKTAPNCPSSSDLGWYVNLKNSQKLTAAATVDKDRVYFPIYEPTSGTNACKTGKAILTAYDTKCGNSLLNVNMGKGVLSKVVIQDDNLYIGLAGEAEENISGFSSKDNLITGKSKAKSSSGAVQIESWKENY
jgi:type IV pilus assembly protein PilY1